MEIDNLKSVWQEISTPQKDKEELNLMLKKNSYPILISIKKQITIEAIGFTAFLFCYFDMFDGADKPVAINLTIIVAILLQLFYGYKVYVMQSRFKSNTSLNNDLESFATKLKSYRLEVILSRTLFAIGLLIFFTYSVNFSEIKWLTLAIILMILGIQLWFLNSIWSKRIARLASVIEEFKSFAI